MTERTNGGENTTEHPGRPEEGQDTSETMDNKTEHDTSTTAVLPSTATPPTQEIAQATQRIPEGPAPEGEVHPAYGVAAARAQAEAEPATTVVQDAPAPGHTDPLAPLRDPESQAPTPGATAPAAGPAAGAAQQHPAAAGSTAAGSTTAAQPAGRDQQAAQAAAKRGPRVGTAVWGLIVIAVGLGILAVSAGVIFDLGVALIVLLGAAGVILVAGSVISSVRRR
jgi:hypothetical protein